MKKPKVTSIFQKRDVYKEFRSDKEFNRRELML